MANMPKRKKAKDNPYTLIFDESNCVYYVSFKDIKNKEQTIKITKEVFDAFNSFELEDISQMHKFDKHIEHSELYEESLYKRSIKKTISVDEIVENKIKITELKNAINNLSEVQRKRIKMYYFDNLNLEQIAEIEDCSFQAVSKSIVQAVEKLKKFIK